MPKTTDKIVVFGFAMNAMRDVDVTNCPACGHAMAVHHGRHCKICDEQGEECLAVDPPAESPGG